MRNSVSEVQEGSILASGDPAQSPVSSDGSPFVPANQERHTQTDVSNKIVDVYTIQYNTHKCVLVYVRACVCVYLISYQGCIVVRSSTSNRKTTRAVSGHKQRRNQESV